MPSTFSTRFVLTNGFAAVFYGDRIPLFQGSLFSLIRDSFNVGK